MTSLHICTYKKSNLGTIKISKYINYNNQLHFFDFFSCFFGQCSIQNVWFLLTQNESILVIWVFKLCSTFVGSLRIYKVSYVLTLKYFSRLQWCENAFFSEGHSATTWTKFYPISTHPPNGHFTYYIYSLFLETQPPVDYLLTPHPPLLVHVVIEWPPVQLT